MRNTRSCPFVVASVHGDPWHRRGGVVPGTVTELQPSKLGAVYLKMPPAVSVGSSINLLAQTAVCCYCLLFTELLRVFPAMAELTLTPTLSLSISLSAKHFGISLEWVEEISKEIVF